MAPESGFSITLTAASPLEKYPAKQHAQRTVEKLKAENGLVYLVGTKTRTAEDSDMLLPFRQRRYFYYITGVNEADCHVTYDIEQDWLTLYIPEITLQQAVWTGRGLTVEEAKEKYDVDEVVLNTALKADVKKWTKKHDGPVYVLHKDHEPPHEKGLQDRLNHASLQDAMNRARVIKDTHEIGLIRKANEISAVAHTEVLKHIKKFQNESQVAGIFLDTCMSAGAKEQAYDPIAAAGENAAVLHYVKNDAPFEDRQLMVLDAACAYDCYAADVTRTFPLSGSWTKEAKAVYDIVQQMQDECVAMLRPGVLYTDIQAHAHKVAIQGLLDLGVFTNGTVESIYKAGTSKAFYPHGLGHHIGLETHDVGYQDLARMKVTEEQAEQDLLAKVDQYVVEEEEEIWRCQAEGCEKLFRGREYLRNHIRNKHATLLGMVSDEASKPSALAGSVLSVGMSSFNSLLSESTSMLEPNMVLTVEPGLYFNKTALEIYAASPEHSKFIDKKVLAQYMPVGGVRIEDNYVIVNEGSEKISTAPKAVEMLDFINQQALASRSVSSVSMAKVDEAVYVSDRTRMTSPRHWSYRRPHACTLQSSPARAPKIVVPKVKPQQLTAALDSTQSPRTAEAPTEAAELSQQTVIADPSLVGCAPCTRRYVLCGGGRPGCKRCAGICIECPGYPSSADPQDSSPSQPIERQPAETFKCLECGRPFTHKEALERHDSLIHKTFAPQLAIPQKLDDQPDLLPVSPIEPKMEGTVTDLKWDQGPTLFQDFKIPSTTGSAPSVPAKPLQYRESIADFRPQQRSPVPLAHGRLHSVSELDSSEPLLKEFDDNASLYETPPPRKATLHRAHTVHHAAPAAYATLTSPFSAPQPPRAMPAFVEPSRASPPWWPEERPRPRTDIWQQPSPVSQYRRESPATTLQLRHRTLESHNNSNRNPFLAQPSTGQVSLPSAISLETEPSAPSVPGAWPVSGETISPMSQAYNNAQPTVPPSYRPVRSVSSRYSFPSAITAQAPSLIDHPIAPVYGFPPESSSSQPCGLTLRRRPRSSLPSSRPYFQPPPNPDGSKGTPAWLRRAFENLRASHPNVRWSAIWDFEKGKWVIRCSDCADSREFETGPGQTLDEFQNHLWREEHGYGHGHGNASLAEESWMGEGEEDRGEGGVRLGYVRLGDDEEDLIGGL